MPVYNAEACECHIVECRGCSGELLVRCGIKEGDRIECPDCNIQNKVKSITGPYRTGKPTVIYDAEVIG